MPDKDQDDEKMFSLEPILNYKMTDHEAKVFKVCLIWMKTCQKILPDYQYTKLPKSGDPRKSHLFRVVWKLLRETKGIIADEDYVHYVRAQVEVLKGIKRANGTHVLIDPACLCGEKAWVRWRLWKKKLESSTRELVQGREEEQKTPLFKIAQEIEKTRTFFARFYDPTPNREQINMAIQDHSLNRWVHLGKVSPYYVLMSPFCRAAFQQLKISEYFSIDLGVYGSDITKESLDLFRSRFPEEFLG
jgi:hypothetical protein